MITPLKPDMFAPECPSRALPIRFGDKWGWMIIRCLEEGPRRFSELRVPLRRVTPKVLTESLRALERDGIITRTAYEENPPRVEYELTALGRSLFAPMAAACDWAREHLPELMDAREEYRRRTAAPAASAVPDERPEALPARRGA
ncbi:helix-turn-helix domain-containing protein [Streptomyces sp. MST-110588]|uniref:winged helix-turn-helix transcriptional regulator n=1 Tax=Streptomyces sp. MST-110588 TaxID=2833628 RepID=UPI0032420FC9